MTIYAAAKVVCNGGTTDEVELPHRCNRLLRIPEYWNDMFCDAGFKRLIGLLWPSGPQ